MSPARRLAARLPRRSPLPVAPFHTSARALVRVGDSLPDLDVLHEGSPGNKVNLAKELTGKGIVLGVPAAFSPSCSNSHIPGYISSPHLPSAGQVFVVSVNDAFVMKAWAQTLDPTGASGIRFLADPTATFTRALEVSFRNEAVFGTSERSKRYALVVENGKVKEVRVEADGTGVDVSRAEKVLG